MPPVPPVPMAIVFCWAATPPANNTAASATTTPIRSSILSSLALDRLGAIPRDILLQQKCDRNRQPEQGGMRNVVARRPLGERFQKARKHQQQAGQQHQAAAARAASPTAVFRVTMRRSTSEPPLGMFIKRPTSCGSRMKTNGTRKAGSVYFHACKGVAEGW